MTKQLLLGCGRNRMRRLKQAGSIGPDWDELTTLDINPDVKPDILYDLTRVPFDFPGCEDNSWDEIHAYEVLEHCGQQGDWKLLLAQFQEFWRMLRPDGTLWGTSPALTSRWLWGDPGHTRVITRETLTFLSQQSYREQENNALTDYRRDYLGDFEPLFVGEDQKLVLDPATNEVKYAGPEMFGFIMRAVKPARIA